MRQKILAVSVFLLLLFAVLSKYEDRTAIRNVDLATTIKVQERIDRSSHLRLSALVGNLMEGATFFASPGYIVVFTLIMTGAAAYDRKKKKWNTRSLIIPIALTLLVIAEIFGKSIVHHPSPPFGMIKHPSSIFPSDYINEQFSYPSGHAARAVFVAIVGWGVMLWGGAGYRIQSFLRSRFFVFAFLGFVYVGLVSVSRIYLGHHWFSDVLGGLLLGSGMGVFCIYVLLGKGGGRRA